MEIVASDSDYKLDTKVLKQEDVTYHIENGTLTIETMAKKRMIFNLALETFLPLQSNSMSQKIQK